MADALRQSLQTFWSGKVEEELQGWRCHYFHGIY